MVIDKPWGFEEIWAKTDCYVGKILNIKSGHKLSLQHHEKKEETIKILSGIMILMFGDSVEEALNNSILMNEGDVFHIKPKLIHRMIAVTDVKVLEVSTPELSDVVRHQDDYNRK